MYKVSFVLLLASVSINFAYSLDICEYQLNGTRLAHPANCNKFVVCKNGQTQSIRNCPIGLHFNRFKGVCDLRERAACDIEFVQLADRELDCSVCCTLCGCDSASTPETVEVTSTPTPETPECPSTPTPDIPDTPTAEVPEIPSTPTPEIPEDPSTPTPETPDTPTPGTPEGPSTPTAETPGNPTPETPDTPTPEIPEGPSTPTPETPTPETPENPATPELKCKNNSTACVGKPDGSVSHVNGTCNQYIVCVGDCANILSCPNNLQYNLATNQCDYPQNVNCPWQSQPPTTGPSGVACAEPGKCAGKPDGILLANPNSNGYIVCQCECEVERPCPAGTKFNETLQVCGHINSDINVNTGEHNNENGSGNGNGNTEGNGNGNAGINEGGSNGNDEGNGNGNDEGNSGVNGNGNNEGSTNGSGGNNEGNSGVNENGNNEATGNATIGGTSICVNNITACRNQTDGTHLPVQGICNKFFICNYNCAVEILCPNNLIYNPNKKYCDYPQNYKCPWPYKPPSGPNAGPSGIACASGGRCVGKSDGTFFTSNNNQTKYVICQCECEVELNCPAGLVWDQKLLTCNYPPNIA